MALLLAISITGLCIVSAMVLDFGLARVDRQIDRSAADSATLAGLHALTSRGDGNAHSYIGVCTALHYLAVNNPRFSGVTESVGWKNGLGTATGNGCSNAALRNRTCSTTDKTTWAVWSWSGTSGGLSLNVKIESGFEFTGSPTYAEDALPASSQDSTELKGCDTLAVTIAQSREPGLGSVVTADRLSTSIRSVGRVEYQPGESAPAMLLLKRTGCPILRTGSSSGGSFIHVLGAKSSNGLSQPGTIHADSTGTGACTGGSNSNIFIGNATHGIVAYAAPLLSNPSAPDPAKPGSITTVAKYDGLSGGIIRDSLDNVYGSSALTSGGTKNEVAGRPLVTRGLIDKRYFTGVKGAIAGASTVFATGSAGAPAGWTTFPVAVDPCKPTPAQVTALGALTSTSKLYINCNGKFVGDMAGLTINAGTVYFRGWVNPSRQLRLPNAHHVYIGNHESAPNADAISLGNNSTFEMNTTGNLSGTDCSEGQRASKAVLFVRSGDIKQTAGTLRMCRTTAFLMGGSTTGCVPATTGTAPTANPCPGINGGLGTGQFTQTGGAIDWTAPDALDATTVPATGKVLATAVTAWADVNGPEDLALWAESGTSSSATYSMAGGGGFHVRGVFMVPNAEPFILSGGSTMNLTNAQYIATSIELNGTGTNITMSVDPNSAVVLPDLGLVGLIR